MTSDDSMPSGEAAADPAAGATQDTVAPDTVARAVDLGSLPASIGYMLRRASLAVNHDLASRAAAIDMRPAQFAVLAIIDRNPGLRQTQVAEALQIKKTNFVALLDTLEARGLVRRERVAADRRSYALQLTPQGRDILTTMRQIEAAHEDELRQRIGPENAALFMQLLARLAQSRRADGR